MCASSGGRSAELLPGFTSVYSPAECQQPSRTSLLRTVGRWCFELAWLARLLADLTNVVSGRTGSWIRLHAADVSHGAEAWVQRSPRGLFFTLHRLVSGYSSGIRAEGRPPVLLFPPSHFRPVLSAILSVPVTPGWADPDPDQQQHPDPSSPPGDGAGVRWSQVISRGGVAHHDLSIVKPRRRKDGHHGPRSPNGAALTNGTKFPRKCRCGE
ncbi:unnamed protein product [Pleuronectes platessa]|uniref:Uncharacterized protein n=1 Tax=Pleuronectes platessa TaxID=8262 RepID=A0A9N7VLZ2_PLEPL|nr:unnamed protein product [Pleuronectes platessa]